VHIAWATDVHLDSVSEQDVELFCQNLSSDGATGLLLSGDIAEAETFAQWIDHLHARLEIPVYFVLGNHDFYGGDISAVRRRARSLESDGVTYLSGSGPVPVAPGVALVGHDGWGDCQIGNLDNFEFLTDYLAIRDLSDTIDTGLLRQGVIPRDRLRDKLQALGRAAADALQPHLIAAAGANDSVLVATHVPPFEDACWHDGSVSPSTWLPGFTCQAIGDLLIDVCNDYQEVEFTVVCGHTHGYGHTRPQPNLNVHTGYGDYGDLFLGFVRFGKGTLEVTAPKPGFGIK
jgi:hypothetical protein